MSNIQQDSMVPSDSEINTINTINNGPQVNIKNNLSTGAAMLDETGNTGIIGGKGSERIPIDSNDHRNIITNIQTPHQENTDGAVQENQVPEAQCKSNS